MSGGSIDGPNLRFFIYQVFYIEHILFWDQ